MHGGFGPRGALVHRPGAGLPPPPGRFIPVHSEARHAAVHGSPGRCSWAYPGQSWQPGPPGGPRGSRRRRCIASPAPTISRSTARAARRPGRRRNGRRSPRAGLRPCYPTRFKMLYSAAGLYVLMDGEDRTLTATFKEDFLDLWTEDVFEFFLWPDATLPGLLRVRGLATRFRAAHHGAQFRRPVLWLAPVALRGRAEDPEGRRRQGRPGHDGRDHHGLVGRGVRPVRPAQAAVQNVPPTSGTRWRANVYRMDYDGGRTASWNWSPVRGTFHQPDKFGTLVFE